MYVPIGPIGLGGPGLASSSTVALASSGEIKPGLPVTVVLALQQLVVFCVSECVYVYHNEACPYTHTIYIIHVHNHVMAYKALKVSLLDDFTHDVLHVHVCTMYGGDFTSGW